MRLQPAAWASRTSASRRGYSKPFCAKCLAVQSRRAPSVQDCSATGNLLHEEYPLSARPIDAVAGRALRALNGHFPINDVPSCVTFSEQIPRLFQPLLLVRVPQRLQQLRQVAVDDGIELIKRQVDAVIGEAVLREIVGADTFAAVARADLALALVGADFVKLLLLALEEPAAEDAHGPLEVFVLAALVLALDFHFLGGAALVPDADGAFGLVDVLAPGAAGPHPLPFDFRVLDLDLDLIRLRQD